MSDTMRKRIVVFGAPQAEFTAQSSVCLGTPVNFINASQLGWGSTSWSSVLWDFGDGTVSNQLTPSHIYNSPGTYTISLTVKSDSSCVLSTKTRTIVVMGKPKADFTYTNKCAGLPINFINLTTTGYGENGFSVVGWDFGDGAQSLQTNPWHTYSVPGTYSVRLIVSGNNCPQLNDTIIKQIKLSAARPDSLYPRVFATRLKRFTLMAMPGGVSYVWTPNIGLVYPDRQITDVYYLRNDPNKILYNIAIKDSNGCINNDKQEVWIFEKPDVFAPTAFTPNGDGANDVFIPFYVNIKSLQSFRIFNRWGTKIYETNDMTKFWDGTLNGANVPMDTFSWVVECYDVDGNKLVRKGMVTLIRD
jgi:gliding motility-associated-like protein